MLTGDDVAALSRPFPAGIDSPVPFYAAALDTARYVGEPIAVVVARDRYLAEDAAELVEVEYEPLDAVLDPVAAAETRRASTTAPSTTATSTRRSPRADLVVRETFRVPALHLHAGRVLRRRRDWERVERDA